MFKKHKCLYFLVFLFIFSCNKTKSIPESTPAPTSPEAPPSKDPKPGKSDKPDKIKKPKKPLKPPHAIGLQNLSNTCYMNSVLQALFHTEKLSNFYLSNKVKIRTDAPKGGALTKAYQTLVKNYFSKAHKSSFSPKDFKDILQAHTNFDFFPLCAQQDPKQFIDLFFDALGSEIGIKDIAKHEKFPYSRELNEAIAQRYKGPIFKFSIFERLFGYGSSEKIECFYKKNKFYESRKAEARTAINIPFPANKKKETTLEKMFALYSKREELSPVEANDFYCGSNTAPGPKKDSVKKSLSFQSLPGLGEDGYLIIQLSRFDYSTGVGVKIPSPVKFPEELSLKSEETGKKAVKLKLYAIVNHFGAFGGGHYISALKSKSSDKWFEINDSIVTEKSLGEVLNDYKASAYLLFYERL